MALAVEKGTFTKTTSTSTPVSQQVNLSNGSLTPKFIILWTTGQTTINGTYTDDARFCYGFSDTTNDCCVCTRADESARAETNTLRNDSIIAIIDLTTNTIVSQADVSAVAAGSFTLNWSVQSNTQALHIHYLVAGGTDITNVSVFQTTVGSTTTGNKSYNGSGTTFTPDFALMITGPDGGPAVNTVSTSLDNSAFSLGAAKSTSKRWVIWKRDETVGTSDSDQFHSSSLMSWQGSNTAGTQVAAADFVSFNNSAGGGITINVTDTFPSANALFMFLLVKGGQWDCGAFQQRSGTGTQDVTLTTGLNPELVFLGGINSATSAAVQLHSYLGIGASDGTNEGASWAGSQSDVATWVSVSTDTNQKVYRQTTPNTTAASSTTDAECDMNDMATASKFQLNWTTADSTQRQMVFWALGTITQQNIERALPTETVSISDGVTIQRGKVRALSTETVSISDSLARMAAKTRTIAQTVTIGETLTRLAAKNRAPATETVTIGGGTVTRTRGVVRAVPTQTVTISDSVSRMAAKTRIIIETVTIGDTLTRVKGAMRSLATETVSFSDNVARVVGRQVSRALPTETVSISDSVARLKAAQRTISQTVSIGDSVNRMKSVTRAISQTVVLNDTVNRLRSINKALLESVPISDSVSRMAAKIRTISQTVAIADSVAQATVSTIVRSITQTVNISDSVARLAKKTRSLTETVPITDHVTHDRIIGEVVGGGQLGGSKGQDLGYRTKRPRAAIITIPLPMIRVRAQKLQLAASSISIRVRIEPKPKPKRKAASKQLEVREIPEIPKFYTIPIVGPKVKAASLKTSIPLTRVTGKRFLSVEDQKKRRHKLLKAIAKYLLLKELD